MSGLPEQEEKQRGIEVASPVERLVKRRVVCAACRNLDIDLMLVGPRHFDSTMRSQLEIAKMLNWDIKKRWEQGFIDQFGDFMNRQEALKIVKANGQPLDLERNSGNGKDLYSEGLY